ncbi:MAG: tRNA (N(6)-L-threonylcarbamoyladenosine(37)-C(2))-methylthiotransferase MtaB [Gemmatales bacterium]|nr:tRNA (N(6)-L-threonylcarbamoyladenosine(37)-C(2))-methylthiotransferase MtaB [Gemmatales bacterium]MDW8223488.1 tRNA (N(6)-L-threonylcarbamoyladenosine(37)-C(2))-methylthiotransferase MtaB [Gemmatales bacterium]
MPTYRVFTLGCKVNQYETQYLEEALQNNGYIAQESGWADLYIVNTCAVTHEAEGKARRLVRRLVRSQPSSPILVTGCYAMRDAPAIEKLGTNVKVIADKARLPEYLAEYGVRHWPAGISRFQGHQRAFVKVQDGCLLNCTFCIIPVVRPRFASRPVDTILAEVRRLVENGYREIVLTGIHLGHYGIDLSRGKPKSAWSRLWHLLDRLAELPGRFRVRLSSLEAAEVRGELLNACRGNPRICPHFHLCLQSGSDRILQAMRRRYRVKSFIENCLALRSAFDDLAISTDIIVGFPGETEEDFQATLEIAERVGFAWIHIFPFSPRQGTPAAVMPDQVPSHILQQRKMRLAELDRMLRRRYMESLVGKTLSVLIEKVDDTFPGHVSGTACRGVRVVLPGTPRWLGEIVAVRILAAQDKYLIGLAEESAKYSGAKMHADINYSTTLAGIPQRLQEKRVNLPVLQT